MTGTAFQLTGNCDALAGGSATADIDMARPTERASAPLFSFSYARWGTADGLLLTYLFLPVPFFLSGLFLPWLGVPATLLAIGAFLYCRPFVPADARRLTGRSLLGALVLFGFAAAWASLGGAGHLFYANEIDWIPRYAVLRDLVVNSWPPRYLDLEGQELLLRAPLGYYLVPAAISKFLGIRWADLLLLAWTWLGVSLFFLANFGGSLRRRIVVLAFFAIASGLDILGLLWFSDGYWPFLGSHIEWWTGRMKYSSNSTMLYWIPNHVLPAWALGAWLWRFQEQPESLKRLPVIGFAVATWTPLPLAGALPLILVLAWQHRRQVIGMLPSLARQLALLAPAAALTVGYFLMDAAKIPSWAVAPKNAAVTVMSSLWWSKTLLFILVEVLVFAAIAFRFTSSRLLVAGVALLCALPFVGFGPTNDLATLGAIPALTILWLTLIDELVAPSCQRRLSLWGRGILVMLFLWGAVTPFNESYRVLSRKHWSPDPTMPAPIAFHGFPPHYFAPTRHWFARTLKASEPQSADRMDWKKSPRWG